MKNLHKLILSILPPLIIATFGYITCLRADSLSKQLLPIVYYAPYVILILAAFLAWRFNRSRSFFIAVILIISLFVKYHQGKMTPAFSDFTLLLCILLPINIVIFSFLKERGIISIWGLLRFGFILIQAGLACWISQPDQLKIYNQLKAPLFSVKHNNIISIPHIALLVFILSFGILIIRVVMYQSSQDISYLFILITLFYIFSRNITVEYSIFIAVIGIILIVLILKDTYSMAFFDELTGLPSRRALNQNLMKLGMKYSIAMLDIDFFKKFNDSYGHDTGDEVLKLIAVMIKDVKCGGKAYRYGGEEFTILFPGKNTNDVLPCLEELREAIAKRGFTIRRKRRAKYNSKKRSGNMSKKRSTNQKNSRKATIHVSIGVANKDDTNKSPALVLKAADTALYRAKKKGRNCVSKL